MIQRSAICRFAAIAGLLGQIGLALLAAPARAQFPAPSGRDAADPGHGFRLGHVAILPELVIREHYNDNIFLTGDNPTADVISEISPGLVLNGDWRSFRLSLSGQAAFGFYARSEQDNYQDGRLRSAAALDLGADTTIEGALEWKRAHDARGGNDVPGAATAPVTYHDVTAQIGAKHLGDSMHYESQLSAQRLSYEDATDQNGTPIANDDRNRVVTRETLRVLVPLALKREAYGEIALNQRQYDRVPDDTGLVRDSAGLQMVGGLRLDLTDLISADIAAGWMTQSYLDPAFGDVGDYTLRADLDWSVTRLTNLKFKAARQVGETTLPGASGILAFHAGGRLSHELRRWLRVSLDADITDEQFRQTPRRDRTQAFGLGLSYQLNRMARIDGTIKQDQRRSNSDGHDYQRVQTLLSLTMEM